MVRAAEARPRAGRYAGGEVFTPMQALPRRSAILAISGLPSSASAP